MEELKNTVSEIVKVLENHKWLHQHRVTDFFKQQLHEDIPHEWNKVLTSLNLKELNSLPLGHYKKDWPESLKCFIIKCHALASQRHHTQYMFEASNDHDLCKHPGLTLKKLHEIKHLTKIVGDVCMASDCRHVIDVGAGVGHLDLHLSERLPLHVLGLEQDEAMVVKATAKAADSQRPVRSVVFKLTEDSLPELDGIVHQEFGDNPLLLTGLHCCGDLSVNVIHSFLRISSIHHLVLLSCCYHSMRYKGDDEPSLKNFPLSQVVKDVFNHSDKQATSTDHGSLGAKAPLINVCSLRLACQQTRASWVGQTQKEHLTHTLNVAYRALLQDAVSSNNIKFEKHKKKLYRIQSDTTFEDYLQSIVGRTSINESQSRMILSHYQKHHESIKFIEPFTALQVMLQPLIELLLLLDRLAYIREHAYPVDLVNIFDDVISPRNCAIIAHKTGLENH